MNPVSFAREKEPPVLKGSQTSKLMEKKKINRLAL